jgi:hypothetical protein
MQRWFLSYNSQDLALMEALERALRRMDPEAKVFFAPKSLRVGGFWLPEQGSRIAAKPMRSSNRPSPGFNRYHRKSLTKEALGQIRLEKPATSSKIIE